MACINPNSPEFKEILLKVNNPLLAEIEMDKGNLPIPQEIPGNTNNTFPPRIILDFSERTKSFFSSQGFEINYDDLKNYPDFINIERGIDLIQKAVYLPSTDTIPEKEAVILGLHLLKKTVEVVNLKNNIKAWGKYTELKNKYIRVLKSNGYYGDKMMDTAEMYVLYDFVTNYFLPVYDKTLSANKTEYKSNNEDDNWVISNLKNLVKLFTKLLKKFKLLRPSYEAAELSAKKIVADILNNNINYNIPQNYELKSDTVYNSTLQEMRDKIRAIGLVETGSSTLRLLGDIYRPKNEIVNDIDSILPYENTFNLLGIDELKLKVMPEEDYITLISSKMNTLLGEDFILVRAFVGKEHKGNKTASLTYTYKGEKLDVFVRTDKSFKNEFENDAKIIESILTNKLSMARTKDIIDYRYFKPKTELQLLRRNPAVQIFKKLSLDEDFKMKQEKTVEFFDMLKILQEYGEDNYYNNEIMESYNNRLMNKIEKNTSKEYRDYIERILKRYITNYPEKYSKGIKLKRIFSAMLPMALKSGIISDINFIEEKVDSKLDDYLVQWLEGYGVEIKSLKEYAVEQGISLSGAVDVINKIVYLANSENRSVNTLAKDVSTIILFMIGKKGYPGSGAHLVASGLKAITSYPKYDELFLEYAKLDRYKQLNNYGVLVPNVDKINYEILSIALSERLVIKHKARTNTDTFWNKIDDIINWIVNLFINKNFISLDVVTDKLANDILKSKSEYIPKKPDSYILKSYEQTLEDNPILVKALDVTFELKGTPTGSLSYRNQLDTYRDINESIHDLDIIFKFEDYKSIDDIIAEYIKRLPNTFITKFINPVTRVEGDKKWEDTYTNDATLYHGGELLGKLVSQGGDLEIVMTIDGKEVPHTVRNINTDEVYKETGRDANGNVYHNGLLIDIFLNKSVTTTYADNKKLSHYVESFEQKLRFGRPKDSLDLVLARNRRNVEPIDNNYIFYNTASKTATVQNNSTIQEAISWIKSIMPDANIELVNELVDDIGIGSYDTIKDLITLSEKYADKRTAKHEVFHKSFNSLSEEKQEKLLEEGSKLFGISRGESKVTVKYSKVEQKSIDYMLKSVDILQSAKAIQTFEKGNKNKWNLDKILTELSIPKEQKQLIIDLDKTNREEIITDLLANYSYTIEINTTNKQSLYDYKLREVNGKYFISYDDFKTQDETDKTTYDILEIPKTDFYSNLTVPGGTNYTEQEIATPAITPSIKGHAQFATDKGIGWFRSDEKVESGTYFTTNEVIAGYEDDLMSNGFTEFKTFGTPTKTRRILEVQSDLFQKGRDKKTLVEVNDKDGYLRNDYEPENQFLQLLNKDNNWVTFFVKSIIQDSAKKGYEKVLFPSGITVSKVEGHTTLEEFKKLKEDRIKELELQIQNNKPTYLVTNSEDIAGYDDIIFNTKEEAENYLKNKSSNWSLAANNSNEAAINEINQLKQELERVEKEGFGALIPIYNFYENTVTNILNKQFGKENVKIITDEYGNTWNEIDLLNSKVKEQTSSIKFKSPIISYTGDLAIEEKLAEMMENTPDEKLPKSVIGKWIQSVRNFFRNLFKERDKLQRFMRDINQGRYANQVSSGIDNGKKYSQLSKQNIEDLFETDTELADAIYKALGYKEKVANFTTEYNLYDIITLQQKQQAIEVYTQYLQSLEKPNTNPTLQDSQKQVKKFVELQERLNNKEFVKSAKNVYDNSKELQELGTQEQYIDFIARVALGIIRNPSSGDFNDSKVTDIVYHGTGKYNAEEILQNGFDSTLQGENKVIFFTGDVNQSFSKLGGKIDAIVNIEQLFNNRFTSLLNKANENSDSFYYPTEVDVNSSLYEVIKKRNPGNIFIDKYGKTAEVTVISPEQIHILSSKQDIDGFKQYVSTIDDKIKSKNTYYQKVNDTISPFEQMSKIDQVAFEKTVRDLAARMSDRIGIPYKIINDKSEQYKGKLTNGTAYINLAYCDMSTISHEVLGHSIIRALKNKSELSFKEQLNKEVYQGNIEKKC